MGLFLAAAGIAGVGQAQVAASLARHSAAHSNEMKPAPGASTDENDVLVVYEGSPLRVTVLYPHNVFDWDDISQHLSEDLKAPVFSFHIHDEDFWMYLFFVCGEELDKFNPIPKYWDDSEPAEPWQGSARVIAEAWPNVDPSILSPYLAQWDLDDDATHQRKAHPEDEFGCRDWQLLDFMKRLGLGWPVREGAPVLGTTYRWRASEWSPQ